MPKNSDPSFRGIAFIRGNCQYIGLRGGIVASALLGGIGVAAMIGCLIIRFSALHARFSSDAPSAGPQKFHFHPTPRIGGIPVVIGAIVAVLLLRDDSTSAYEFAGASLLCG